ncbi:MAG: PIN domain-containing protein [Chloroflexia bacterium]|nr:PIN domain-containing protein [Chloroflexia bacterium]
MDTSAFFAAANPRDVSHGAARSIQTMLVLSQQQVITSNFVLAETHGLILSRINAERARRVLREIILGTVVIERITEEDERRAFAIVTQYVDKDFSFIDATSFAVMERLGIDTAFAFDRHFSQYGFRTLTVDQT